MPTPMPSPGSPPGATQLSIRDLSVSYGRTPAVEGVSFDLRPGAITGLIGPNGAGKSTLIKAIVGLQRPSGGHILLDGSPLTDLRALAYVPQRSGIDFSFPITVHETALLGTYTQLSRFRRPRRAEQEWASHCLWLVGMADHRHRPIGELSGGQAQRVFIARALTQRAQVFLLDEPFVGIDMASEEQILRVLREQREAGRSILVVHHDLSDVGQYFDDLLVLNRHLVAAGPTAEVFQRPVIKAAFDHTFALWQQLETLEETA